MCNRSKNNDTLTLYTLSVQTLIQKRGELNLGLIIQDLLSGLQICCI